MSLIDSLSQPANSAPAPTPAPAPNVSAPPPATEQTSSSDLSGQQLQAPAQTAPQPPMQLQPSQPPVTATSKNPHLHSFIGRVLGALAGPDPVAYQADENGVARAVSVPRSTSQRVSSILNNALVGLASGTPNPNNKASLWMTGLGRGAVQSQATRQAAQDRARAQSQEDIAAQQRDQSHKMQMAQGNALLYSTMQHVHQEGIDKDPIYKMNTDLAKAAETANIPVKYLSGDQLTAQFHETPQQLLTENKIIPIGETEVKDPTTGATLIDPQTKGPMYQRQYAVIDGMAEGGKIKVPQSLVDEAKKYGKYSTQFQPSDVPDGLANSEVDIRQLVHLTNMVADGHKNVLSGEEHAITAMSPDGKTPILINSVTKEPLRDDKGEYVKPNAVAAGSVTDADRYNQQQENYRAQLKKQTDLLDSSKKAGATQLEKSADTYQTFANTANTLKQSINAANNGNELANSVANLQTTLFITTAEGVKRINETELKGVAGAGDLARRINASLDKAGKGTIPAATKKEMAQLVDIYQKSKYGSYLNGVAYTAKLRGLDPETTPVLDKDGGTTTLSDAMKGVAPKLPPAPAGKVAVQIPGSPVGFIDAGQLEKFKKDHPNATVGE
jgi:hypothetical protein